MDAAKTSLSAGAVIRSVLIDDPEVSRRITKIYPVATTEATLPYITYRRQALSTNPSKAGQPGADTIKFEILCFTKGYSEGVELAEAVRNALDMKSFEDSGPRVRGCFLDDALEDAVEDTAFIQQLIFNIKI